MAHESPESPGFTIISMNLFGKYFKITLISILFIELLSFLGYLFLPVNYVLFFLIILATLILSLVKLEYGIYIILTELFIGSKGYLFFFEYEGITISLRIALFLIVMAVWLLNFIKNKKTAFFQSKFRWYYLALFLAILWGVINGFFRNEFNNMFFDFNAWMYLALIFPTYDVFKEKEKFSNLWQVFTASTLALGLKTLFFLYIFSHDIWELMYPLYKWIRDTGVGEITLISGNFHRIFIQSQIFILIAFFLFIVLLIYQFKKAKMGNQELEIRNHDFLIYSIFVVLSSAVIIISFSRSFWVGIIGAGLVFLVLWIVIFKDKLKFVIKPIGYFLILGILSVGLIYSVANFPYPKITDGFSASKLEDRATNLDESAVSSRWQLLPELWKEIKKYPIFGEGYGATVTYKSFDPRIMETTADSLYTTYAFEWGYLDIWLKLGLAGLIIYLILIYKILENGWKLIKNNKNEKQGYLYWGAWLGLIAILITSFFSPYLNHPLGIGYLMLCSVIFDKDLTKLLKRDIVYNQH